MTQTEIEWGLSQEFTIYKHSDRRKHEINYMHIPVTKFDFCREDIEIWNDIYRKLLDSGWDKIVRTRSGGISIAGSNALGAVWDCRQTNASIEITLVNNTGMWRWQISNSPSIRTDDRTVLNGHGKPIYGRTAFKRFRQKCEKAGICLENYESDNGSAIKETIQAPPVKLQNESSIDNIYKNCYHVDFHSSYPAGLCNAYPEFRKVIEPMYELREQRPMYKAILNFTIGFMQSNQIKAKYAALSKAAIEDNNKRVYALADMVREAHYVPLLYNTDGFWYHDIHGLGPFHGPGEGDGLGQWHTDHHAEKLRIKSAGAYEFIENGKYYPVIRGRTLLDLAKHRRDWEWGDIYNEQAKEITYKFIEGVGIIGTDEFNERAKVI